MEEIVKANVDLESDFVGRMILEQGGEKFRQCIQCGMCVGSCPNGYFMDYPPRKFIAALRANMLKRVIQSNTAWTCISCFNCSLRCPSGIKITDVLIPNLREEILLEGKTTPQEVQKALENTSRYGNPLGESPRKRADWTKEIGIPVKVLPQASESVEVLWFVECYPSYNPRNILTSQAFARILNALKVNFGILGHEEFCAGDDVRLVGEKGLFEMLIEHNTKILNKYKFDFILFTDPHGYNAFKNEYPKFGVQYETMHYTEFLVDKIDKLKSLFKKKLNGTVTYHDPCYLGRRNGEYEAPRELLKAIPGLKLVEMPRNRENALCCGGGGGGIWLDSYIREHSKERLSEKRVKEAYSTGANILAVACPYDMSRFEDAIKITGYEGKLIVKDIIELIDEAM
jgi:Fe-S oxidoreductase